MSGNNGWPGKPGVPMNPEREGHHWILTPDGEDAVYLWRPAGECERGRWPSAWIHDVDDWDPREGTYLGPCLKDAEVDARVAVAHREWLAELNHDTDALIENARRDALEEAAQQAAHYERMAYQHGHLPAGYPHECAAQVAREIEAVIRALKGEGDE